MIDPLDPALDPMQRFKHEIKSVSLVVYLLEDTCKTAPNYLAFWQGGFVRFAVVKGYSQMRSMGIHTKYPTLTRIKLEYNEIPECIKHAIASVKDH